MKFNFLTIIAVFIIALAAGSQTANAQKSVPAKDASLIAFLVKDAELSSETIKAIPYLGIAIGKIIYIVESKSGKVVSQSRTTDGSGGFYGAYAEVLVMLLDANKNESGGSSHLLKLSAGKWKTVALNETNYQCADVKSVPKAVLKALKIECY